MSAYAKALRITFITLFAVFVIYAVAEIAVNSDQRQWDFRTYYYAALTDAAGGNPYDLVELNRRSPKLTVQPFIYPPPTLVLLKVFATIPFGTAYLIWLFLKVLLAGGLILLWRRYLFPDEGLLTFALFLLLAFGATFYIDLVTGNITIIEQLFLWLGLIFLIRRRPLAFCAAILLASSFKLTPVVFLLLMPLVDAKNSRRYIIGAFAVFVTFIGLAYLLDPGGWEQFFASLALTDEPGRFGNPSTLAFCRDLATSVADKLHVSLPTFIPYLLFGLCVCAVAWISWRSLRSVHRHSSEDRDRIIIFLFCLAFALIMPRFKTYSFVLLLPPAYYVIRRSSHLPAFGFLMALVALTAYTPFPIKPYLQMFWTYYPLFLTVLIWGLLIQYIRTQSQSSVT
ncbi:MAG: DUF2029 domain-containing protein [Phycisphaerales bacterium]|nr:MAG: DUF2029 domain-containing protein [Phycisphaerales bacterium]